ncbi:peroxisomal acyl-coenzyme A oxidase 1-like [Ostrea edulis]|uniref:peroxisomal acyl-coenzyme A oxidase 1-like n=1 Tax=Ostrea edulis TaxID=37623 RepID=UPI0024AED28F|nr:peroxisomal acyl-coenzyme A oxidase 1-like [Ostrea edulis]
MNLLKKSKIYNCGTDLPPYKNTWLLTRLILHVPSVIIVTHIQPTWPIYTSELSKQLRPFFLNMSSATVNPDLARERAGASFDVKELTNILYGGPENVKKRRYLHNVAIQDPVLARTKPWAFRSREEEYNESLRQNIYMYKKMKEMGLNFVERAYYSEAATPTEANAIGVHSGMFTPTIEKQGTEDQKAKWLPLARDLKIIGTYAQTELGHGTFIRGLETIATYDARTKEFVINSPTVTSVKYWPGGLGKTSNCCLVMAQLETQGKRHGIHMFMVQLRDFNTHKLLPGVEAGDIGPKFGFNGNDNGYLRLNNVRVPREHMLMRYAKVLEDGTYIKPPDQRIGYGTMVFIRALIISNISKPLGQACTIAVRYSAVRRQTEVSPGGIEAQIIDYQTQQYKLFPMVATAYAMHFTGQFIQRYYTKISDEIEAGNLESFSVLHALCAGLKAFSTWNCTAGIETCRLCCGGHGYSHASGLPKLYSFHTPGCTYEGENNVMMLQLARFLMKIYPDIKRGAPLNEFLQCYTVDLSKKSCMTEEVALGSLVKAYEHRAARLLEDAAHNMERLVRSGKSRQEAWNASTVALTWAATAFCHLFVVNSFVDLVNKSQTDKNTKDVLTKLCKLYAVHGIIERLGEFIQDGFISPLQITNLQNKLTQLMAEIRPNAVAVVDAFDYPDKILDSCLGRYDGQVYQALYEYAKNSPFNEKEVLDSYFKYVKPSQGEGTSALSRL